MPLAVKVQRDPRAVNVARLAAFRVLAHVVGADLEAAAAAVEVDCGLTHFCVELGFLRGWLTSVFLWVGLRVGFGCVC